MLSVVENAVAAVTARICTLLAF